MALTGVELFKNITDIIILNIPRFKDHNAKEMAGLPSGCSLPTAL